MSDEESFVILGSCSLKSDDGSLRSGFGSLQQSKIIKENIENATKNVQTDEKIEIDSLTKTFEGQKINELQSLEKSSEKEKTMTSSVNNGSMEIQLDKAMAMSDESQKCNKNGFGKVMTKSTDSQPSVMSRSTSSSNKNDGASLAASFILGEVKADVLKTSVYSQFPSLCSMESCAEDIHKLQNFMAEYVELKSGLATLNSTMRQYYNTAQQWRDEMLKNKEEVNKYRHEIVMLRNENLNLRHEMQANVEQMRVAEKSQKQEITQLTQVLSEKTALIDNMRAQLAHLEEQQLASYDYISKHENDAKQTPEYISTADHLLAVKELERKMSAIVAENYEIKGMEKIYLDEINCLKVNLVSAEELLDQAKKDIELLKSKDVEKSKLFEDFKKEREELREELGFLRQQVEVYSKDFQMERTARESLAGEKDQLVQDLRALQRSNQQLIEEQQRRLENTRMPQASTTAAASGASPVPAQVRLRFLAMPPKAAEIDSNLQQRPIRRLPQPTKGPNTHNEPAKRFSCPVCNKPFDSLTVLQSHVNRCLDNV